MNKVCLHCSIIVFRLGASKRHRQCCICCTGRQYLLCVEEEAVVVEVSVEGVGQAEVPTLQ